MGYRTTGHRYPAFAAYALAAQVGNVESTVFQRFEHRNPRIDGELLARRGDPHRERLTRFHCGGTEMLKVYPAVRPAESDGRCRDIGDECDGATHVEVRAERLAGKGGAQCRVESGPAGMDRHIVGEPGDGVDVHRTPGSVDIQ